MHVILPCSGNLNITSPDDKASKAKRNHGKGHRWDR